MTLRMSFWLGAALALLGTLSAFQLPFREFPGVEYRVGDIPMPGDALERTEWAFARLMYPPAPRGRYGRGFGFRGGGVWTEGNSIWTQDYPRADRHFSLAVRRLTRIHVRSVEQPVNLDEGGEFDWPWLYAVQTGSWQLTDAQAKALREYLLRGGFLVTDDFWGPDPTQWEVFRETMDRVLPGHPITDIALADPVMHVLYDIEAKDLTWIPGTRHIRRGAGGGVAVQRPPGTSPAWRSLNDDAGRMVVAVNYNTDIGDAWEYADSPMYPEAMTALAYRYGVNYLVYAMTH